MGGWGSGCMEGRPSVRETTEGRARGHWPAPCPSPQAGLTPLLPEKGFRLAQTAMGLGLTDPPVSPGRPPTV